LRAACELGAQMFDGYPRFAATAEEGAAIVPGTASVPAKPAVHAPDDWFSLVTRLRVVMEDPRQLLSGAVTDYASSELVKHDNDPSAVIVPGLDGEPYPAIAKEQPERVLGCAPSAGSAAEAGETLQEATS
jgi:hypothetical protein